MSKLSTNQTAWIRRLARRMPFYRHLGITLTNLSWGRSEMKLRVRKELTQGLGAAHGGVLASLIDSVVGIALCTMITANDLITTIELKVNFIVPAKPGLVRAYGKILHRGSRIAVGDGEVRDENGTLVAKGLVTYMIMGRGQRVFDLS